MYSFIFDVDGTLIDSYDGITKTCSNVLSKYNYKMNNLREYILDTSVLDLFRYVSNDLNVDVETLFEEYKKERRITQYDYKPMKNMVDTINYLYSKNYKLFIYTHKGNSINQIVKDLNIDNDFIEIISSDSTNFKRKPNPDCINYLVDKYNLDRNNTFYVGDRKIDIECANNANIKSILFNNKKDIASNYKINDFKELNDMF